MSQLRARFHAGDDILITSKHDQAGYIVAVDEVNTEALINTHAGGRIGWISFADLVLLIIEA